MTYKLMNLDDIEGS